MNACIFLWIQPDQFELYNNQMREIWLYQSQRNHFQINQLSAHPDFSSNKQKTWIHPGLTTLQGEEKRNWHYLSFLLVMKPSGLPENLKHRKKSSISPIRGQPMEPGGSRALPGSRSMPRTNHRSCSHLAKHAMKDRTITPTAIATPEALMASSIVASWFRLSYQAQSGFYNAGKPSPRASGEVPPGSQPGLLSMKYCNKKIMVSNR